MYANIEIIAESEKMTYVLNALIDLEKDNSIHMPCLSFYKNYECITEELIDEWDNDTYVYHTFYKNILLPWVNDKTINDSKEFGEVMSITGILEDFSLIKDLIEKAIELNFFSNTKIESE